MIDPASVRAALCAALFTTLCSPVLMAQQDTRPRARDIGVAVGVFDTGTANAITDVAGVRVGHSTVRGESGNTGVTAILPPGDDWFRDRVPAAIVVGNGFGKLLGVTQVTELGELETPILLTCTLCVWRAADAMVDWLIARPGMDNVRSINPVVGETNDGALNDIRSRPVTSAHVVAALENAGSGAVEEGAVGAGAGTVAFGWKGGIGTSSRVLPEQYGGYTVGVIVQSNYGGILTIAGAPVGQKLGQYSFQQVVERRQSAIDPSSSADVALSTSATAGSAIAAPNSDDPAERSRSAEPTPDGSIMIVIATDAPLGPAHLERLARRSLFGLARTGSIMSNGSGDYIIAFSTADSVRRRTGESTRQVTELSNDALTPLFQAVAEATEEAIYNSMLKAVTTSWGERTVEALPIDRVVEVLREHGIR
jgi:D-aminopeptidase